jgi:uncharacterized protein (TIGR02271 family)
MITQQDLPMVSGAVVYGAEGEKIGKASQVYLDDATGEPDWVTVSTGLFSGKDSFVPLRDARLSGEELHVPYSKDQVKDAPRVSADEHLDIDQEAELYRYYNLDQGAWAGQGDLDQPTTRAEAGTSGYSTGYASDRDESVVAAGGVPAARGDRDRDGVFDDVSGRAVGHDTSGLTTDDAMTRSEERLDVGTERVEAGRARLRKYVVTDQESVTVPVSREEIRVEREPITDATYDRAVDGPAISEEEHEVVLTEERPVVTKEAVPVERVRLDKDTVTDHETVSEEVRKEEIETVTDGTRDTTRRS